MGRGLEEPCSPQTQASCHPRHSAEAERRSSSQPPCLPEGGLQAADMPGPRAGGDASAPHSGVTAAAPVGGGARTRRRPRTVLSGRAGSPARTAPGAPGPTDAGWKSGSPLPRPLSTHISVKGSQPVPGITSRNLHRVGPRAGVTSRPRAAAFPWIGAAASRRRAARSAEARGVLARGALRPCPVVSLPPGPAPAPQSPAQIRGEPSCRS